MVSLQMDGIAQKASELGKDLSWLTGAAGFLYGVDSKWTSQGVNQGTSYPFSMQGFEDALAGVAGRGVVKAFDKNYAGSADQVFNLGAIINKGTGVAAVLWGLKEFMPNKYTRLAYNVGFAPALGYGIGRIFDDPVYSRQGGYGPTGYSYPTGGAQPRNMLPVSAGAPWSG